MPILDLHANVITPGAVLVLGVGPGVIAGGDGQSVAGVPIDPAATLVGFGMNTATADSIARIRLQSQDQVDPINGEDVAPGATSIILNFWKFTNLKYKSGQRVVQAGTNVGVVAGTSLLLDAYPSVSGVDGSRHMIGQVITTPATTFGAALVANTWGAQPYAPASPLPNGRYAILGSTVSACTQAAIRFVHASFKGYKPGYICADLNQALATGIQTTIKIDLVLEPGWQFITLSHELGFGCCPVFDVTNAGTGLTIEMIAAQAATPVVTLYLAKVG